jgi:uncharacterized membrane protein (DUF4010 family)
MISFDGASLFGWGAALGGGLLVGTERERRQGETAQEFPIGVRTCVLTALAGASAAMLGIGALIVAGFAVASFALASYWHSRHVDPGLTTELSVLTTYLLAALAMSHPRLAAALFVLLAIVLASKEPLHRFLHQILSRAELNDGLLLAASALIVLPMLPDRAIDPFGVLNPRKLWLLVLWVMVINTVGYIGLRRLGMRRGLAFAGFFGGFISGTATIAGMAQRAKANPELMRACISAALLSNVATVLQLALILAVLAPSLLIRTFGIPLLLAGATAVVVGTLALLRAWRQEAGEPDVATGHPFVLSQALLFAAGVAVALFVSAALSRWAGASGMYAAAAATGLADVHAAAIAIGQVAQSHAVQERTARGALVIAFFANSAFKCMGAAAGGIAYFRDLALGLLAINAAMVVPLFFHLD